MRNTTTCFCLLACQPNLSVTQQHAILLLSAVCVFSQHQPGRRARETACTQTQHSLKLHSPASHAHNTVSGFQCRGACMCFTTSQHTHSEWPNGVPFRAPKV